MGGVDSVYHIDREQGLAALAEGVMSGRDWSEAARDLLRAEKEPYWRGRILATAVESIQAGCERDLRTVLANIPKEAWAEDRFWAGVLGQEFAGQVFNVDRLVAMAGKHALAGEPSGSELEVVAEAGVIAKGLLEHLSMMPARGTRQCVAYALGGKPWGVSIVERLAQDEDEGVAIVAVDAMAAHRPLEKAAIILRRLRDQERRPTVIEVINNRLEDVRQMDENTRQR